jgi:hypothetical protein
MSDDRRKPGLRLNGRSDAEIEDMAKVSVAELSTQEFFSDDVNRSKWPNASPECRARRAMKSCQQFKAPPIVIFAPMSAVRRGDDRGLRCLLHRARGCSPKPSNHDHPPLFRELRPLNAQQHVARS